jgi:hypothetical protein
VGGGPGVEFFHKIAVIGHFVWLLFHADGFAQI